MRYFVMPFMVLRDRARWQEPFTTTQRSAIMAAMTGDAATVARPPELTVVVVLTYISAIASIVLGVLLILARYAVPESDSTARTVVTIAGAVVVLVGFMIVSVASGIARGDRKARVLATALIGLAALVSLVSLVLNPDDLWAQLIGVLINGGVIVVLWTGRVRRYFAQTSA